MTQPVAPMGNNRIGMERTFNIEHMRLARELAADLGDTPEERKSIEGQLYGAITEDMRSFEARLRRERVLPIRKEGRI